MTTAQDAISALVAHVGISLGLRDGFCEILIDGQPFSIRHDEVRDRLIVSALVADDLPAAPSRQLVCDLLDLGFGMMEDGLPAVGRDPETGFLAAFAIFPLATLSPAEFPDAFDKFVLFATALADRLDAERAGVAALPAESEPPAVETAPAFGTGSFMPV